MKLVLFDFDGTLTTRDSFAAFLREAVPQPRRTLGACVLAPWLPLYRAGRISGVRMRAMAVRVALTGLREAPVRAAADRFWRQRIPGWLRPEAIGALRAHRDAGDRVIVVSGAFEMYLADWCRSEGVACLASRLETRNGRLAGRYLGAQCVGAEKARRVRETCRLADFDRIEAWGDTPEDAALLALADRRMYRGRELASDAVLPTA